MMKYVDTLVNFIKRIVVRREKRGGSVSLLIWREQIVIICWFTICISMYWCRRE